MTAVVAPRCAVDRNDHCHCCGHWRRCAVIWIDRIEQTVVRGALVICSRCIRAAEDAAVERKDGQS